MNSTERGALSSSKGHNQVSGIAEQEPDEQSPHDDLWCLEPFGHAKQFNHYIDDGTGSKSEEENKDLWRMKDDADHGSQERWSTTNQPHQSNELPGHRLTC